MEGNPRPKSAAPVVPVLQAAPAEGAGRWRAFEREMRQAKEGGAPCIVLDMGPFSASGREALRAFLAALSQLEPDFDRVVLVNLAGATLGHLRGLEALERFRAHFQVGEPLSSTVLLPPKPPTRRVRSETSGADRVGRAGAGPRAAAAPAAAPAVHPGAPGPAAPASGGQAPAGDEAARPATGRLPTPAWSPPGFEVLGELGRGALASVYKARHLETGRLVAVKVLDPRSAHITPQFVKLFANEAKVLQGMEHENVLRGLGGGSADGRHYVLMEYVKGTSLQDLILEKGRLEEKPALRILAEVTKAVRYLESEAFLHGDIKPGNIMIEPSGRAKLCDLGMANWISLDPDASRSNLALGTKGYLAPERESGAAHVDVRSEIYSLGVTLHRMVLGFAKPGAPSVAAKFGPDFVSDETLSTGVRWLIARMTAWEVKDRFVNTDELLRDLGRVLNATRRFDHEFAAFRAAYLAGWQ
ncbi:MAG: serine/threonine protein kinase [Planctomycetes bacterium]|nr:serine/threonine protein kinase [Planctomycetota bacterium]